MKELPSIIIISTKDQNATTKQNIDAGELPDDITIS